VFESNYNQWVRQKWVNVVHSVKGKVAYIQFSSQPEKYQKKKLEQDDGTINVLPKSSTTPLIDLL
jgi:hypothetical protein